MIIKAKILRMPEDLAKFIEKKAKQHGLTQNALILQILWDWEEQEKLKGA